MPSYILTIFWFAQKRKKTKSVIPLFYSEVKLFRRTSNQRRILHHRTSVKIRNVAKQKIETKSIKNAINTIKRKKESNAEEKRKEKEKSF